MSALVLFFIVFVVTFFTVVTDGEHRHCSHEEALQYIVQMFSRE